MRRTLAAIILSIGIAGLSQGLVVPLLAYILEQRGVSAWLNGLSTTSMYLAVLLTSPFIEPVIRRFGTKRVIQGGALLCLLVVLSFPLLDQVYVWMVLRFFLGIGVSVLFVATEIWLLHLVEAKRRGKVFAYYGLSVGLAFSLGPLGINLLAWGLWTPFLVSAALFLLPLLLLQRVPQEAGLPESRSRREKHAWLRLFRQSPFALSTAFVYGFMEGALAGDFPIYGLRQGMAGDQLALAMSLFTLGSTVLQLPLGYISDRYDRRKTLIFVSLAGGIGFALMPFLDEGFSLFAVLAATGGVIGSLYSLGLAYVGEQVKRHSLTTANVLYTANYGVGSMLGPSAGALTINLWGADAFPWTLAVGLILFALTGIVRMNHTFPREKRVV